MEKLWTPWRMGYVGGAREAGCIFCDKTAADDDRANLILHRGQHAFVIMNLYPYNTGHVMIVPYAHVSTLATLPAAALAEMTSLLPWITALLERILRPAGFNVGLNIGDVAGAGIAAHLHMHVVPRWVGDANFMPILANTTVMPELIPVTQAKLLAEIARHPFPKTLDDPEIAEQAGGVVIDAAGQVAVRRAKKGDYVLPKGHIEAGESAATAAVREVIEYFLLRVEQRLPEFAAHDGVDTFFVTPDQALALLTFDDDRALVEQALQRDAAIRAQGASGHA
jgi:ATP adenylyltransferase